MSTKHSYTVRDIEKIVGLSPYMTDYLCRTGIVVPSSMGARPRTRGRKRRYSFENLVLLQTYAYLLAKGVSVKRLKDANKTWARHFAKFDGHAPPKRFLFTDGEQIYFIDKDDIISDLTNDGQIAFRFVLDVHRICEEVFAKTSTLPR